MIDPPSGLSGTTGNPITIRALNEGAVLIDGQFARVPIRLEQNHWFTVEGLNVRNGTFGLFYILSSSNITGRRIVGWDLDGTKDGLMFLANASPNVLWEDVAGFGIASWIFGHHSSSGGNVTCRRCWGRTEGSMAGGDAAMSTYHINYGGTNGWTCENCLGTASFESQAESFTTPDGRSFTNFRTNQQPRAIYRLRGGSNPGDINLRMLGSIAYVKATDRWRFNGVQVGPPMLIRSPGANHFHFSNAQFLHVLAVIDPSNAAFNTTWGFHQGAHLDVTPTALMQSNTTSIRGSLGDVTDRVWAGSNRSAGTSLGAVPSPWTTTGTGANLCFRWKNRAVTKEPLWPWPMNERIKAATAMAGAYGGPCLSCSGGRRARTATDVTADIQELLGNIAPSCRSR